MKKSRASEIKVGIFVTIVLVVLMVVIVALSSKSSFFKKQYVLETSFENIAGLIEGAEVRLAGVDIGFVRGIRFSEEKGHPKVFVNFTADTDGLARITKDSRATIDTLGLLGKKYIEIVPGDPATGFVSEGDFIEGAAPVDFVKELQRAGEIVDNINRLSGSLQAIFASLRGDGEPTDLSRTIASIKNTMARVEKGPGTLHALIYDEERETIVNDVAGAISNFRKISEDIREGEGTLHALIYGRQGEQVVQNLMDATAAVEEIVTEIKTRQGVLHKLIYESEREDILDELSATTKNLNEITDMIRRGEGTLGGLVVDPTVYEDLLKITGKVQRSRVLKGVVRHTIATSARQKENQEESEQ